MNRADLDKQIANAAARAAVAARNGDDDAWREWSEWATRLLDQRDREDRECAYIHSDEFTHTIGRKLMCAPASFYARPAS